ncbi:DEAD/DEAH box helicase [Microbacterium sp. NPDC055665]
MAYFVVDAALDVDRIENRHVVSFRSYSKTEGMLELEVPPEASSALREATAVHVFRVDPGPFNLLTKRCEALEELDRGPRAEELWSSVSTPLRGWSPAYLPLDRALNEGQRSALAAMTTPGGFFVWGPPGTGKTTVITSAVKAAIDAGQSVLITSHTNVAVDNVLESLIGDDTRYELGVVTPGRVVRQVGSDPSKILRSVQEHPFLRVDRAAAVITNQAKKLEEIDAQLASNHAHPVRRHELFLREEIAARAVNVDQIRQLQKALPVWDELTAIEQLLRAAEERAKEVTRSHDERVAELGQLRQLAQARKAANQRVSQARGALAQWQVVHDERRARVDRTSASEQTARAVLEVTNVRLSAAITRVLPWVRQHRLRAQAQASLELSRAVEARGDAFRDLEVAHSAAQGWALELDRATLEVGRTASGGHGLAKVEAQVQGLEVRLRKAEDDVTKLAREVRTLREIVGDTDDLDDRVRQAKEGGEWALALEYDESLRVVSMLDLELAEIERRRDRLNDEYQQTKVGLLGSAPVIAATLTALITNATLRKRRFDVVIIDESASAEASLLLIAAAKADTTLAVVGDFLQNAPIAEADDSTDDVTEHIRRWQVSDIFALAGVTDRATAEQHPRCVAISIQYRYPPVIARAVNEFCYDGLLQSHKADPPDRAKVIVFLDTSGITDASLQPRGNSWECPRTREIAVSIAARLIETDVGYVTPYRPQASAMARDFSSAGLDVPTGTSHEFQGREFDTVIFDLMQDARVRWVGTADLNGSERAVGAAKLLNVALTRAKKRLYIIGNWRFVQGHDSAGMRAIAALADDPAFDLRVRSSDRAGR